MLKLAFSMVLGMLWLKTVGPRTDWSNGAIVYKHSGNWISLPSQLSDTLPITHDPRLLTVESATQFAKMLQQCDECYCFMLNFTHCAIYGGNKVAEVK